MRILIAEDDYASRMILFEILSEYGVCDLTINGIEAVDAFIMAFEENKPYDLVCLDIMMPKVDGLKALKAIRDFEKSNGIKNNQLTKIIIITALADNGDVHNAVGGGNELYVAKPLDRNKLIEIIDKFKAGHN